MTSTIEKEVTGVAGEEDTDEAPQSVDDIFDDIFGGAGKVDDPERLDKLRGDFAEAIFEYRDINGEVHQGGFDVALGCSAFKSMLLKAESYEDAFSMASVHKKEIIPEEDEETLSSEEHIDEPSETETEAEDQPDERDEESRVHEAKIEETRSQKEKTTEKDSETRTASSRAHVESMQDKHSDASEQEDDFDSSTVGDEWEATIDSMGSASEGIGQAIADTGTTSQVAKEAIKGKGTLSSKNLPQTQSRSWRELSRAEKSPVTARKKVDVPLPSPVQPLVSKESVVASRTPEPEPTHGKKKVKRKLPTFAPEYVTVRRLEDDHIPDISVPLTALEVPSVRDSAPRIETNEDQTDKPLEMVPRDETMEARAVGEMGEIVLEIGGEEIVFFERDTDTIPDGKERNDREAGLVSQIELAILASIERGNDEQKGMGNVHLDEILLNTREVEGESDEEPTTAEVLATSASIDQQGAEVLDIKPVKRYEDIQKLALEEETVKVEVVLEQVVRLAKQEGEDAIPQNVLSVMKKINIRIHELKNERTNVDKKRDSQLLAEELILLLRTLGYKHPEQLLASFLERHSIEYLMTIFGSIADVSQQPHTVRTTFSGKIKSFIAMKIGKHALMKSLLHGSYQLVTEG